jgi:hypothetical protein
MKIQKLFKVLALVLIASGFAVTSFAEGICKIGTSGYPTIAQGSPQCLALQANQKRC